MMVFLDKVNDTNKIDIYNTVKTTSHSNLPPQPYPQFKPLSNSDILDNANTNSKNNKNNNTKTNYNSNNNNNNNNGKGKPIKGRYKIFDFRDKYSHSRSNSDFSTKSFSLKNSPTEKPSTSSKDPLDSYKTKNRYSVQFPIKNSDINNLNKDNKKLNKKSQIDKNKIPSETDLIIPSENNITKTDSKINPKLLDNFHEALVQEKQNQSLNAIQNSLSFSKILSSTISSNIRSNFISKIGRGNPRPSTDLFATLHDHPDYFSPGDKVTGDAILSSITGCRIYSIKAELKGVVAMSHNNFPMKIKKTLFVLQDTLYYNHDGIEEGELLNSDGLKVNFAFEIPYKLQNDGLDSETTDTIYVQSPLDPNGGSSYRFSDFCSFLPPSMGTVVVQSSPDKEKQKNPEQSPYTYSNLSTPEISSSSNFKNSEFSKSQIFSRSSTQTFLMQKSDKREKEDVRITYTIKVYCEGIKSVKEKPYVISEYRIGLKLYPKINLGFPLPSGFFFHEHLLSHRAQIIIKKYGFFDEIGTVTAISTDHPRPFIINKPNENYVVPMCFYFNAYAKSPLPRIKSITVTLHSYTFFSPIKMKVVPMGVSDESVSHLSYQLIKYIPSDDGSDMNSWMETNDMIFRLNVNIPVNLPASASNWISIPDFANAYVCRQYSLEIVASVSVGKHGGGNLHAMIPVSVVLDDAWKAGLCESEWVTDASKIKLKDAHFLECDHYNANDIVSDPKYDDYYS